MRIIINRPGSIQEVTPAEHFISNYDRLKDKEGGNNPAGGGGIYTGFGKTILFKRDCSKKDIAEFLAARLLNLLIGNSAAPIILARKESPEIKPIPDVNSEETDKDIYIGSIFTEGYEDFYKVVYREEGYPIPADRPRYIGSFNQGPVQRVLLQEEYTDFERIMVSRLLLGDFDVHIANFGVVWPVNAGGQKHLMAIDYAAAFRNLKKKMHLHSHLRHLPGRGPTNHYRECPRALRVSWAMVQEMERVANYSQHEIGQCIDKALADVSSYYSNSAIRAFAKRLNMKNLAQIKDEDLLSKLKKYLKKIITARQKSLQERAIEIQLSLCCKYDSSSKEWYVLSDIYELFEKYPNYFLERHNNSQIGFHFRDESHKGYESKLTDLIKELYKAHRNKGSSKNETVIEHVEEENKDKFLDKENLKNITGLCEYIKTFCERFNDMENKFKKLFLGDLSALFCPDDYPGLNKPDKDRILAYYRNSSIEARIDLLRGLDNEDQENKARTNLKIFELDKIKINLYLHLFNERNKLKINRLKIEVHNFEKELNKFLVLLKNIDKLFHADTIYNPIDVVRDVSYLLENLNLLLKISSRLARDFSDLINKREINSEVVGQKSNILEWNSSLHKLADNMYEFYNSISELVINSPSENISMPNRTEPARAVLLKRYGIELKEILKVISIRGNSDIAAIVAELIGPYSEEKYIEAIYKVINEYRKNIPWYVSGQQIKLNVFLKYLNEKISSYQDKKKYIQAIPKVTVKPNFAHPQKPEVIVVEAGVLGLMNKEEKYRLFGILVDAYNKGIEILFVNGEEKINKARTEKGLRIVGRNFVVGIYNMPTLGFIEKNKHEEFDLKNFFATKKNANKVCFITSSLERAEKAKYNGYQTILAKQINANNSDSIFLDNLERRVKINEFSHTFKSTLGSFINMPLQVYKVLNNAGISAYGKLFSYLKACWEKRYHQDSLPMASVKEPNPSPCLNLNDDSFKFPVAPPIPTWGWEPTLKMVSAPFRKITSYVKPWLNYIDKGLQSVRDVNQFILMR